MKITAIELTNIRGFKLLPETKLSKKINVFIGANNAGKSTILKAIHSVQMDDELSISDVTIGQKDGVVKLYFEGAFGDRLNFQYGSYYTFEFRTKARKLFSAGSVNYERTDPIPTMEPKNLIYPYLSKRKSISFSDEINEINTNAVTGNFTHLFSKIDRLVTPQFKTGNTQYIKACQDILGFEISTIASRSGKKGVYYVHNQEHIPLQSMGEGVTNIIGLITDLCVAENKIFIIEEPENDIHPTALKALMNFVIEKSDTNQFFVSTHSNIVMKYLGGAPESKIFSVNAALSDPQRPSLFVSTLKEISDNHDERRAVLEDLGYEFNDFGLWSAWLFLEESSAEVLIREWFIKWYVPELSNKLRTFSANSLSQIIPKFDDFNKLFVFLHLEPAYKNKVWVIIDGGNEENKIIEELHNRYIKNGWDTDNFSQFSEHDFENYYPTQFKEKIALAINQKDKQKKRIAKKELLNEIKAWIVKDEKTAKAEFKKSAQEIINKLKEIAKAIE